jgi:hypothetical protein
MAHVRVTEVCAMFSAVSFLRTTAARKARTVCGCQPVERVTVAMLAPLAAQARPPWSPHTLSLRGKSSANWAMVLLALPLADHLLIERDRGQFVPSRRRRMMANRRAERLLKIRAEPSPDCVSPALQLKREWSPWPDFGSDRGNPRDLSEG